MRRSTLRTRARVVTLAPLVGLVGLALACERAAPSNPPSPPPPTAGASAEPEPGDAAAQAGDVGEDPADRDGDGVRDRDDRCPDACEVINGIDDDDGCPDPSPADDPELRSILGVIEGLEFAIDKPDIRPASFGRLDTIAVILLRHPAAELAVEGHRDARPRELYAARDISERRAQAVRNYLIGRGVEPRRLTATGYGEERPLESDETAEGRARNRRVELVLRNPEPRVADTCVAPPAALGER